MTATELRFAISQLGTTQVGLARALGVEGRTVRRWIAGEHRIPAATAKLLLHWLRDGRGRLA